MQVVQETLLAFRVEPSKMETIRKICRELGVKAVAIKEAENGNEEELAPLGLLAGARGWMNPLLSGRRKEAGEVTEEMLVFVGFSDRLLDLFLKKLRQNQASVSLKAVLTEQNAVWNARQLQEELKQERRSFQQRFAQSSE